MKAIETIYDGHRFRSRLEARWAVFLSALGIRWKYEFEGFVLQTGEYYLPDFWLPKFNGGMYVEVKPDIFSDEEKRKCFLLCELTQHGVWLANDVPDLRCYEVFYWNSDPPYVVEGEGIPLADKAERENRMFAMSGYGRAGELVKPDYLDLMGNILPRAVQIAKQARFEHGQSG